MFFSFQPILLLFFFLKNIVFFGVFKLVVETQTENRSVPAWKLDRWSFQSSGRGQTGAFRKLAEVLFFRRSSSMSAPPKQLLNIKEIL